MPPHRGIYGHIKPLTEADRAVLAGGAPHKHFFADDSTRYFAEYRKFHDIRERHEKLAAAELPLGKP